MDLALRERVDMAAEAITIRRKAPALRPEGHNAFWEGARPWLVFLGATVLTAIATYVMAKDSIDRLRSPDGTLTDGIAVAAAVGLGILVDAAIVISGMRTHQERSWWRAVAQVMFVLCLLVEGMTLAYFYRLIQPESVPAYLVWMVDRIHDLLYFFRSFLPPVILAFLGVAVRNLVFSQADRKRRMLEQTGARLMTLEERLADPSEVGDKPELIREYEAQLALFEYASDATEKERAANAHLVATFRRIWGVATEDIPTERAAWQESVMAEMARLRESIEQQPARKGAGKAAPSGTDLLANALASVGVTLIKSAQKSVEGQEKPVTKAGIALKGGWIVSSDIVTLSGGKIKAEQATTLAKSLGDGFRNGTRNACPLRPVLRDLAERNVLIEPVLSAWKQVDKASDSAADAGGLPVIMAGDAVANG